MRVPPKLMANIRDTARSYGKSDPIDALAMARAAQREPDLPTARLDGKEREIRLSSTIVKTSSPSEPASSAGCAGICMKSTPGGRHRESWSAHCIRQSQRPPSESNEGATARRLALDSSSTAAADRRDRNSPPRSPSAHQDRPLPVGHRGLRGTERGEDCRGNRRRRPVHATKTPTPATTAPRRYQSGHRTQTTASLVTQRQPTTQRRTTPDRVHSGPLSPASAMICPPPRKNVATAASKPSASSSAASRTSSIEHAHRRNGPAPAPT